MGDQGPVFDGIRIYRFPGRIIDKRLPRVGNGRSIFVAYQIDERVGYVRRRPVTHVGHPMLLEECHRVVAKACVKTGELAFCRRVGA